jgi:hypothetical protein
LPGTDTARLRADHQNARMLFNPGALVYGTIAVGALLAAESARRETYPKTLAAVGVTLLLYWLAHSYAEYTGHRLRSNEPMKLEELGRSAVAELSVLIGAGIPLIELAVFWAAGVDLDDAVIWSIYSSAAIVMAVELVAGLRADLSGRQLAGQTIFGALLGGLIIALRVILKH